MKHESNQGRLSTDSAGSDNHQVFTLFCKLLEMDETVYSSGWDFESESLPFCASCASLAIRVSRLYEELAVIQQEIILSTDIIKGTLAKSQDSVNGNAGRLSQSDQRIDAFRSHAFQGNVNAILFNYTNHANSPSRFVPIPQKIHNIMLFLQKTTAFALKN
jgi:hypothetical protein